MSDTGWIKLHRKLYTNPIIKKPNYLSIWIYLLCHVNHKNIKLIFNKKTITIKSGQLLTGRKKISTVTGISESKVQRILKYLENEHQIEQQMYNLFRIITIINWNEYQSDEQQNEQPVNSQRTASEQPVNTNKNDKNDKKGKKYGDFVFLTDEQYKELVGKFEEKGTLERIENLNNYAHQIGLREFKKRYASHYHVILNWERKNKEEEKNHGRNRDTSKTGSHSGERDPYPVDFEVTD